MFYGHFCTAASEAAVSELKAVPRCSYQGLGSVLPLLPIRAAYEQSIERDSKLLVDFDWSSRIVATLTQRESE